MRNLADDMTIMSHGKEGKKGEEKNDASINTTLCWKLTTAVRCAFGDHVARQLAVVRRRVAALVGCCAENKNEPSSTERRVDKSQPPTVDRMNDLKRQSRPLLPVI